MGCAQSTVVVQEKGKELQESQGVPGSRTTRLAEASGHNYCVNDTTGETSWSLPPEPQAQLLETAKEKVESGSLQQLRSAAGRLRALQRVTLAPPEFLPSVLPGDEDEDDQRQHMAERQAFAEESAREWEVNHEQVEREAAERAEQLATELAQRTKAAAAKLYAGVWAVGAVVRWTRNAHERAEAEAEAAAAAEATAAAEAAAAAKAAAEVDSNKPTLLSLEECRQLRPVTSYFGRDGPQDDKLTVYGTFGNCALYAPTRGPLVTDAPFQFCLVTGPDVEEIIVLADNQFPVLGTMKPHKVESGQHFTRHVFFGEMNLAVAATKLNFYNVQHEDGRSSLAGLFEFDGCITKSQQLENRSRKEDEVQAADACASAGDVAGALQHLNAALVYNGMDAQVLTRRAELHLKQKIYDAAVADAERALSSDRGLSAAWAVLAEAEFTRGCYGACAQACNEAPDRCVAEAGLKGWLEQVEAKQHEAAAAAARFTAVDRRAVECPETPEVVGSVESLANWLTTPFETDIEKHRVIFRWIAENISYNAKALQTKNYEVIPGVDPFSPEGVLKARTGVCSAYSRLYKGMADVAGIETVCVSGFTYSCKNKPGKPKSSHEWNCIKVDGTWHLCDSTWAAGSVDGNYAFTRRFEDFWWMTPPEHFIYTHLPEKDTKWTCLTEAIPTVEEFRQLPDLKGDFFKSGLQLASHKQRVIQRATAVGGKPTKVTLRETGQHCFLMAHLDGKNLVTEYDQTERMHTVLLEGGGKELALFWGHEEYGSFAHLLAYSVR